MDNSYSYNILAICDSDEDLIAPIKVLNEVALKFGKIFKFENLNLRFNAADINTQKIIASKMAKHAHALIFDATDKSQKLALYELCRQAGLHTEIRHIKLYPNIKSKSVLDKEVVSCGIDSLIVCDIDRNCESGGFKNNTVFGREAYDVEHYSELEIERVARIAYELAQTRSRRITLIDASDTRVCSKLWRKIVTDINEDYPFVQVEMMHADEICASFIENPSRFDVLLTSKFFGDVITNIGTKIAGNKGIITSAMLGDTTLGAYGTAAQTSTSINTKSVNAIDSILSAAFMLRFSFDMLEESDRILRAVEQTLSENRINENMTQRQIADEIILRL